MTDEEILKKFYNDAFCSKEYQDKINSENGLKGLKKEIKKSNIKKNVFFILFIIAIGYFLFNIPILFYPIMFSKDITDSILLVLIAGLIPLIVDSGIFLLISQNKEKANRVEIPL